METEFFKIILNALIGNGGGLFAIGSLAFAYFMYKQKLRSDTKRDEWQGKYIEGIERENEVYKTTREYIDGVLGQIMDEIKGKND